MQHGQVELPAEEEQEEAAEEDAMEEGHAPQEEEVEMEDLAPKEEEQEDADMEESAARRKAMAEKKELERQLEVVIQSRLGKAHADLIRKQIKEIRIPSMASCMQDANVNLNRLTFAYKKVQGEGTMLSEQEAKALEQARKRAEEAATAMQKLQETVEARKELYRLQLLAIGKQMAELQKEVSAATEALVNKQPTTEEVGQLKVELLGEISQGPLIEEISGEEGEPPVAKAKAGPDGRSRAVGGKGAGRLQPESPSKEPGLKRTSKVEQQKFAEAWMAQNPEQVKKFLAAGQEVAVASEVAGQVIAIAQVQVDTGAGTGLAIVDSKRQKSAEKAAEQEDANVGC